MWLRTWDPQLGATTSPWGYGSPLSRGRQPVCGALFRRNDLANNDKGNTMEIGFIGLGNMGFPMARRLVEAGHKLTVFDTRKEAVGRLTALGAEAASSPKEIADRVETV